jgi:predicted secreted protein
MKKMMCNTRSYCFFTVLLCFLAFPALAAAEGLTARYLENSEKGSILEINVENPAPTSIIIKQHIPAKTRIATANPSATKFAVGKGEVTWLIKAPKPGVQRIRLQYEKPLSGKKATAVIRCKSPLNGKLMTIRVQ